MLKRIFLFLVTNIAIIFVISVVLSIFNVQPYITRHGLNYESILAYAAIVGFTGAGVSLFMSKFIATHAYSIQLIEKPNTPVEQWLLDTVTQLARSNQIGMPDVGIYDSPEPNAFATGWNKNNALVAVSTGLLQTMNKEELEGVLGHEIAHIANGDMVTLTLIQGVINTFVIFFARIAAFFVSQLFRKNENEETGTGFVYYAVVFVFEILFGILASIIVMWFSRQREYRADAGSAQTLGKDKMIKALEKLNKISQNTQEDNRSPAFNAMMISKHQRAFALFSSHPPLEERIARLKAGR